MMGVSDLSAKFNQFLGNKTDNNQSATLKQQQVPAQQSQSSDSSRNAEIEQCIQSASALVSQGLYNEARMQIDKVVSLSGGLSCRDSELLIAASRFNRHAGYYTQSLDYANRAIEVNPNAADYYVSKGMSEAMLDSPEVVYPAVKKTLLTAAQKGSEGGQLDSKAEALGYLSCCGFNSYILNLKAGRAQRGQWPPEIIDYANQSLAIDPTCIYALRTLNNVANERQQMEAKRGQAEKNVSGKISLTKGKKVTLEKGQTSEIIIENGWTSYDKDYDLKALVRYRDGRTVYVGAANQDEVLVTPEGAVRHGGDVLRAGELERIYIKWDPSIASIAVSSYSALENGAGSFCRYGVFVRIINGGQVVEIPAADTSANDLSYTLCFGEIIFGRVSESMQVTALEMYSAPKSENRIGYAGPYLFMDIGPSGKPK